jgi:hypothetical protein
MQLCTSADPNISISARGVFSVALLGLKNSMPVGKRINWLDCRVKSKGLTLGK